MSSVAVSAAAACFPHKVSALMDDHLYVHGAFQQAPAPRPVADKIQFHAWAFPLDQVRLLDGPFLDAAKTNQAYLRFLPEDSLLHTFRVNAKLPSSTKPLGGWENPQSEVRGHFIGHYLSACALTYASMGDDELKAKGESMVAEMAKCQKTFGDGYLSAFPQEFFDRLREGRDVWAPYYTVHKLIAGLLDMYTYCGAQQALESAEGMARWIRRWANGISDEQMQRILKTEHGGIAESLLNLYGATGREGYLELAHRFEQPDFLNPLSIHRDELKGLHVNTNIPKVIAAARRYELTGDPYYREVARYFWEEITAERSFVTGGTSNAEFWQTDPGNLSTQLSIVSQECCCEYNMLKLTRHVYEWDADPRHMDYYERALFNSRLGTQHPDNGMKMYYFPLQAGYWKYFHSPLNSFWCCTGTGVEEFSKFGDSIYFHGDHDVFVNLLIASEVRWPDKGLTLRQETRFPEQAGTTLTIKAAQPVPAGINFRIPSWATGGGSLKVNDETVSAWSNPGSYLEVRRTWKDGDKLELNLPMRLHSEPLLGDPSQQAVMYGPIVLAARLGTDQFTKQMQFDNDHGETHIVPRAKPEGIAEIIVGSQADVDSVAWLQPINNKPLSYEVVGQKSNIAVIPLYQLFDERYAVYWKLTNHGT